MLVASDWGLGAPADPAVRAKGDGIVIIRSLVNIGPIKTGMNFCYGHGEKPRVKVGDIVEAGQWICDAGLANAFSKKSRNLLSSMTSAVALLPHR